MNEHKKLSKITGYICVVINLILLITFLLFGCNSGKGFIHVICLLTVMFFSFVFVGFSISKGDRKSDDIESLIRIYGFSYTVISLLVIFWVVLAITFETDHTQKELSKVLLSAVAFSVLSKLAFFDENGLKFSFPVEISYAHAIVGLITTLVLMVKYLVFEMEGEYFGIGFCIIIYSVLMMGVTYILSSANDRDSRSR